MALEAGDVDEAWFAQAGAVLINGTHLSQPNVYAASLKAARRSRRPAAGWPSTSTIARCCGA
jgi:5-dehydro-2-deoxygluconokinase